MVQLSHPYMTTGKTIALTRRTFVGKVMSLLFNELSRFVVYSWASLVAQLVRNPPAMQETWVWSLGWEDPMEEGMATHSCILVCRIPWTEEPGRLQSMGLQRVRYDWATKHMAQHSMIILTSAASSFRSRSVVLTLVCTLQSPEKLYKNTNPWIPLSEILIWSENLRCNQDWKLLSQRNSEI